MSTGVTHGADTDRLRVIAADLSGSARTLLLVQHAGTSSMGALLESWAGPDTQVFAADWQQSVSALAAAAERLSTLATLLVEQAEEQDRASGGAGSPAFPTMPKDARDVVDAIGNVLPATDGARDGWLPDLRVGLKVANVNWSGARIRISPTDVPFVEPALKHVAGMYEDWQDSGLTWFEGMFVPWALPDEYRNKYLALVDGGTDWANDIYKDHVRDLPGMRQTRWAAHKANDVVECADLFITPLDRAMRGTSYGLGWSMVKDTVNDTTEILDDPKGWWDQASGLDQLGVAVSVIPVAGWAGKGVVTAGKRAFKGVVNDSDLLRKLVDDRGSVPVGFGFGKDNPKPGDYPEWIEYSRKPPSAHPLPEDFEPGWAATKPGGERGMDYQEQLTGVERLPDGRVPEYIVRDPVTGQPVAFDGHLDASSTTPETFSEAKDGYRSLVTDPDKPWADGMKDSLLEQAKRQIRALPEGAALEWNVSDPDSADAIREILYDEGYTSIHVTYVPKEG